MDFALEGRAAELRRRRIAWAVGGSVALVALLLGLGRLKPAAPRVERAAVWIDTVRRGPLVRQVRGPGSLVPEEVLWISSRSNGQVARLVLQPGSVVQPDSILLELSSPEVEQAAFEAESEWRAAEADLKTLAAELRGAALGQEAQAAAVETDAEEARLHAEADAALAKEGLVSDLTRKLSGLRAAQLSRRAALEKERVRSGEQARLAQLEAQRARVDLLRSAFELRRALREALRVRAGLAGVLQEVAVEAGQRVTPGTNLARVARPDRLKAELRIPETQAKDVTLGLAAEIDTRNGVVGGRVVRVDPSVREGSVTVDVAMTGALPAGARPDLSVDGTIELERLADVLFVGRPAFGQSGGSIALFRLEPDGRHAARVTVELGRASVNTVEILGGLVEGDRVILSDMAAWDAVDRVRLN